MSEEIKLLIESGSEGMKYAIEGYAEWYFIHGMGWLAGGMILVFWGIRVGNSTLEGVDGWFWIRKVAMALILLIGMGMIFDNTATLFSPEAYALHHLINDINP